MIKSRSLGYIEGSLSAIVNLLLFALKYWVGAASGSVAMIADAWHTLSDTLTSFVVLVGFWLASRPADRDHPFGHGRAEAIGAIVIATLLGLVGLNFLRESIHRIQHFQSAHYTNLAVIVFIISFVIKELLARFSIWAGKKIDSQSLIADGWHHRSDAVASALIVIAAVLGTRVWWLDGVMGILVSLLILYATYDVAKSAVSTLLGEKPDSQMELKIRKIVNDVTSDVSDVHHFHLHSYGDHKEVTFHIRLAPQTTLSTAHDTASQVEDLIWERLRLIATVHLEPSRIPEANNELDARVKNKK